MCIEYLEANWHYLLSYARATKSVSDRANIQPTANIIQYWYKVNMYNMNEILDRLHVLYWSENLRGWLEVRVEDI